jgi:signal transduction histidine kinase
MRHWGPPTGFQAAVFLALTLLAIIWQYRRLQDSVARRQIRWLAFAALFVGGAALFGYFIPPFLGLPTLDRNLIGLTGVCFPLAIAIGILRHNLFDIDTLLNRALVYSALTVIIFTLYVLVVGVLGILLQASQDSLLVALAATGVAAVLFQPLRDRLQRAVNRLMYGERDEPFEVLSRLGQRLEHTLSPDKVYPTIVETVSQALKLPYTAIAVWRNGRLETVESYGKPVADPVDYPLTYQGEPVGQLQVARRGPGEAFSVEDERILRNIARQAGAAVHAVQLMADLRQSRQQLVTTREEERRRLRRDLHDGLGATLAALHLQAGALRRAIRGDLDEAEALVDEFRGDIRATIDDIRRLVDDLRPPTLDQLGLAAAVRAHAARCGSAGANGDASLRIEIDAPEEFPSMPAAVEVAAYRIAQEAMTNVVRHARASRCLVRLALADTLLVEVVDDGVGITETGDHKSGLGLLSMRERATELGGTCIIEPAPAGGSRVLVSLPLTTPAAKKPA